MRYSRLMAQPPKKKRRYTALIIVIVILAAAVYFAGAGAAGGWLAENVINPVFNNDSTSVAATSTESSDVSTASVEETVQTVNLPAESGTRVEEEISADEVSLYALQVGAFSEEDNAKNTASSVRALGGAGFVAYDGELYRVLIAAYTDESDAKEVKTTLESENVSTSVFTLSSGTLTFKIGAEQSQIDAIKACFNVVPEIIDTLQQIIYDADKGENVDAALAALRQKATEKADNLEAVVSTDGGAMQSLSTYMQGLCKTLENIPLSTDVSEVEFSSELKYNLIGIVIDYSTFLDEIGS